MNIFSTSFRKESDWVTRCIGGETIIVPVRAHVADLDSIYTLNEMGTLIWDRMDGRTSVTQIVETICNAYDVHPEEATNDVVEFLGALEAAGLIRPALER